MQDIISFVNEQLCWEKWSPHRHDCHDPPHEARGEFLDDRSPPRRLAAVARSDPWKVILRRWNSRGTQFGGEDCPGLRGQTSQRTTLARFELASECLHVERGLVVQDICYSVKDGDAATETASMGTPAITLDNLNKVVVGFLNGGRTKGYVHNFSSLEESFNILPQDDPLQGQEIKVAMKDLKAVFFVWEFAGNPESHDSLLADAPMQGRGIEVTFTDGEKIVGRPEGYNSQRIGFFMYPANPKGNNIRIFVVTRNTRQVRLI